MGPFATGEPQSGGRSADERTAGSDRSIGVAERLVGAALLAASGGIHLDLYLTGYRNVPTIGVLFLAQVAAALLFAAALVASRLRLVALLGAGLAASTVGGYVLSLWTGLFGFHEVRTTAGVVAGALELAAVALLGAYALRAPAAGDPSSRPGPARLGPVRLGPVRLGPARRGLGAAGAVLTLALVVAAANAPGATSAGHGAPAAASSAALRRAPGALDGAVVHVSIRDFAFVPARVVVEPGERVVVTNHDSVTHTFTAVPGSRPLGRFDTGDISPGTSATVRAPTAPGAYAFYCRIHPFMTGTLVVR